MRLWYNPKIMRVIKTQKGFTIVETLIVLVVTGFLFVATALLVSGQINKGYFRESSLNAEQVLNDAINDTNSGYFDSAPTTISGCGLVDSKQGTSNCIYAGKEFSIDASAGTITSKSVYIEDDKNPFVDSFKGTTNELVKNLPSGMDYGKDVDFLVLFEGYPDRTDKNVTSEAQNIGVYAGNTTTFMGSTSSSGVVLCASNNNNKVKYTFGVNGSPTVIKEFTDAGCP